MSQERLSMRKFKEVLRLKYECRLSNRQIAKSCRIARSTVADYLQRAQKAGLSWPLAPGFNELDLQAKLFVSPIVIAGRPATKTLPDFVYIHNELRAHQRLNLTLDQLWQEYKEHTDEARRYGYSQFCELYGRYKRTLDLPMRQSHKGGEKLFIDYADGLFITNPKTGELILTQLFVATWGASNYTYAEASLSQTLPNWVGSHVRAFDYFRCVPQVLIPDNLKAAVTKACLYEPDLNPTYADMAGHYGCAVVPARPVRPKDKAVVENGVLVSKRWLLSVLRHRTFFSVAEINVAIAELLEKLNTRPMRKIKKSRRDLFETLDRPNARPLPEHAYVFAEWKKSRVHIDYHIEVDRHYYSVPFRFVHQEVHVRFTATTLEVFLDGQRIAAHARSYVPYTYTTLDEHMPSNHQKYLEWTPERLSQWAAQIGPSTVDLVKKVIAGRPYPPQAYRSCLGILRLAKSFTEARLEAAAARAVKFNTCSYKSMKSILDRGMDRLDPKAPENSQLALFHDNIRGRHYYH